MALGKMIKQISGEMSLSHGRVRACVSRIYKKLGVRSSNAAVAAYVKRLASSSLRPPNPSNSVLQYRQALLRQEYAAAIHQWACTPEAERPPEARIHMCVMYLMQERSKCALDEAGMLIGNEAQLVFLLQRWLAGDENALPMLQWLVASMAAGSQARSAGLLGLYLGGLRKALLQVVQDASREIFIELEREAVRV